MIFIRFSVLERTGVFILYDYKSEKISRKIFNYVLEFKFKVVQGLYSKQLEIKAKLHFHSSLKVPIL